MAFQHHYQNLVSEKPQAHTRLIRDYDGANSDFDLIVIGSGMGGGILADEVADRHGQQWRILVLEAGSFIYPTHVYNISRVPNTAICSHFDVDNIRPWEDSQHKLGGKPQMAFGGRSIFWSGLIPELQTWELDFFPPPVRGELADSWLHLAGERMHQSRSLGTTATQMVEYFRGTALEADFQIAQTPRALHQPYLHPDGTPRGAYFDEPTGVFNTAELLINQAGLTPGPNQAGKGLFIKLATFVEGVFDVPMGWHEVRTTSTINGAQRSFYAPRVVIAAGALESPKLINRSAVFHRLPPQIRRHVGFGLTDHPVTAESQAYVRTLGGPNRITLSRRDHAKIIFYTRGLPDAAGHIRYPFNIEMNVNHEYWHLRNNDPSAEPIPDDQAKTRIDIKFSFANCLDDSNGIFSHAHDGYVPEVRFKRFADLDDLLQHRFPACAGWQKSRAEFFHLLNSTRDRIFNEFTEVDPIRSPYGEGIGRQWPFGWGTVHHACGTLRMPWKSHRGAAGFAVDSVVDENLQVRGEPGLYVCDLSVMPFSTAANPVRTLAALALRLAQHLG